MNHCEPMRPRWGWGALVCAGAVLLGCSVEEGDTVDETTDRCAELAERVAECVELEFGQESVEPLTDPSCDPDEAEMMLELSCDALLDPKADLLDDFWWIFYEIFTPACEDTNMIIEDCWPECAVTEPLPGAFCVGPEYGKPGRVVDSCESCVG